MTKCELCDREGAEREIFDIDSNRYDIVLCHWHYANWMVHGSKKIDAIIANQKSRAHFLVDQRSDPR